MSQTRICRTETRPFYRLNIKEYSNEIYLSRSYVYFTEKLVLLRYSNVTMVSKTSHDGFKYCLQSLESIFYSLPSTKHARIEKFCLESLSINIDQNRDKSKNRFRLFFAHRLALARKQTDQGWFLLIPLFRKKFAENDFATIGFKIYFQLC